MRDPAVEPICPHCQEPVALVAWLIPPAATAKEPSDGGLVPLLILVVLALLAVAAPAWGTSMPARSAAASTDFIPLAAGISFALDQARSRVSVEASSCSSTTAVAARPGFRLLLDRSWEPRPTGE
jgi:hypothetical protein